MDINGLGIFVIGTFAGGMRTEEMKIHIERLRDLLINQRFQMRRAKEGLFKSALAYIELRICLLKIYSEHHKHQKIDASVYYPAAAGVDTHMCLKTTVENQLIIKLNAFLSYKLYKVNILINFRV